MRLSECYIPLKKGIVAFVPKYLPANSDAPRAFPPIIGTGFVVDKNGLIVTNRHVIRAFGEISRPPDAQADDWGVQAMLFYPVEGGVADIRLPVIGVAGIAGTSGADSGLPPGADLGIVHVKATGLPELAVSDTETLTEGLDVATAGFPMGSRALEGPDGLYQLCPTLQRGIISAVLPFPGRRPKAFSVQIMTHGGASGSPVFLPDSGRVVGVLYAALSDTARTARRDACTFPTGISYAVPARAITRMASRVREMPQMRSPADAPDLNQLICENTPGHIYRDGACYPVRPAARPLSLPNLELLNPKKEVVHE